MNPSRFLWLLLLLPLPLGAYQHGDPVPADFKMPLPVSLEESVRSLRTLPGWTVELMAAEPLTMDPIFLDWAPDGKLWVVEMADYPRGIDGKGQPGGRVRLLEDRDGDGNYDKSTIFLEGLNYPTGIKSWKKGAIVIAAPEIFYAEDTDGDRVADKREVLYRGFREGNQQHRVNGPWMGLDNWLYLANGDSGGTVESVKTGAKVDLGSFDLRIRPETGEIERVTGRSQFGRAMDDAGRWFGCSNSRPLFQLALEDRYLRRNPHAVYPAPVVHTPVASADFKVHPISPKALRYNDPFALSRFTSACGIAIHGADAFICEPVHNLIQRQRVRMEGSAAASEPMDGEMEWLASSDPWFRPVSARVGPDGAIWVADMYRYVIEHPEWIPEPWQKVLELRAGSDRGRIYRVYHNRPDSLALGDEWVKSLASPVSWRRDMARQLILEHGGEEFVPALERLALSGPGTTTDQALATLDGLGKLRGEFLAEVLRQQPTGHGIRLSAQFANEISAVLEALLPLETPAVELGYALGEWKDPRAGEKLGHLALAQKKDPIALAAAMTSLLPHLDAVTKAAVASPESNPLLPYLLSAAVGEKRPEIVQSLLATRRFAAYAEFFAVLDRKGLSSDAFALGDAEQIIGEARALAQNTAAKPGERADSITLLARRKQDRASDTELLFTLLAPNQPADVQAAALSRLRHLGETKRLLERWPSFLPGLRRTVTSACLEDAVLAEQLLTAVIARHIDPFTIDAASRDRFRRHSSSKVRLKAEEAFGAGPAGNRQAVIDQFQPSLQLKGEATRGKEAFTLLCSACHQMQGIGRGVGADLNALADKSAGAMLVAILDPNRAVEDKFLLHEIQMKDGRVLAGMVAGEAGANLELIGLDGNPVVLPRQDIASVRSSGRSMMPEGLEAALDARKMADLIAFLQQATP